MALFNHIQTNCNKFTHLFEEFISCCRLWIIINVSVPLKLAHKNLCTCQTIITALNLGHQLKCFCACFAKFKKKLNAHQFFHVVNSVAIQVHIFPKVLSSAFPEIRTWQRSKLYSNTSPITCQILLLVSVEKSLVSFQTQYACLLNIN